jgi:hypothetical protein
LSDFDRRHGRVRVRAKKEGTLRAVSKAPMPLIYRRRAHEVTNSSEAHLHAIKKGRLATGRPAFRI